MAINYPGPYEVRVHYTTVLGSGTYQHEMRFSVDLTTSPSPGADLSTLTCPVLGGGTVNLVTFVEELAELMEPFFSTNGDINRFELWEYEEGTFNATWIGISDLGIEGTSGSPLIEDAQIIFTFRSTGGGYAKIDVRHTVFSDLITQAYPTSSAPWNAFITKLAGTGTPVLARDNGYLVNGLNVLSGKNEKLFKHRLRP